MTRGLVGLLAACWRARVPSVFRGPTSSRILAGSSRSTCTAGAKRTVSLRCRVQYWGSTACSEVIHVPVTVDTKGIVGGESLTPRTTSPNGVRIGSIIGE